MKEMYFLPRICVFVDLENQPILKRFVVKKCSHYGKIMCLAKIYSFTQCFRGGHKYYTLESSSKS